MKTTMKTCVWVWVHVGHWDYSNCLVSHICDCHRVDEVVVVRRPLAAVDDDAAGKGGKGGKGGRVAAVVVNGVCSS